MSPQGRNLKRNHVGLTWSSRLQRVQARGALMVIKLLRRMKNLERRTTMTRTRTMHEDDMDVDDE